MESVVDNHIKLMLKELSSFELTKIEPILRLFRTHSRIIFCTMGKSAFACSKIVYTARSYGLDWHELDVCHAFHGDAGIIKEGDLLVLVSKSGDTPETVKVAEYFNKHKKIAVTSEEESTLSNICSHLLYIPTEEEGSPFGYAPMISTTLYMIVLHAVLCDVIEYRDITLEEYAKNHPEGSIGKQLKLDENLSPKNSF